jgi:hypothetical protein
MPDEKAGVREQVVTILRARRVNEDHRRMRSLGGRTDQSASELDVAVGEANIFTSFGVHSPCGPRRRALPRPCQRRDLAAGSALNLDPRLDRVRNRRAGACEETVRPGRIQYPQLAGFVECDKLIGPGELRP